MFHARKVSYTLLLPASTKPGRSDRNSRPSSRRHGRLASRSAGSRIAPDCSGYCPGRANQSGTGIAVSSGRLGWPSVHTASFTSPSSRFALSQAVQRAQSSASRLVRKVLALVDQPVLRTTAFQVLAGVLTIVAISEGLQRQAGVPALYRFCTFGPKD